jgi:TonB family protein
VKCLWPSTKAKFTKTSTAILPLATLGGVLVWCAMTFPARVASGPISLPQLEEKLHRIPAHISEFAPVWEPLALPKCGKVRLPEALLTPDPPLNLEDESLNVRVSFIVGADGHVHSPFVLESGGAGEDQTVLRAIRFWRYRPALCNGVPTDYEALVRFSIR